MRHKFGVDEGEMRLDEKASNTAKLENLAKALELLNQQEVEK